MKENKEVCPLGITEVSSDMERKVAFVHRSRNPQSFRRARICKFARQKRRFFLQLQENRPFVDLKRLTHTQARSLKHTFRCLNM